MIGPAFSCVPDVGLESLRGVVSRMIAITQDPSAKPASQLSAVRLVIGLERQIFYAAKEELLARRAIDPAAPMNNFQPVISVAIIQQLITFLTNLIHHPDIVDRDAVRAGNLLLSLQRLALAETKWRRLHNKPRMPKDDPQMSTQPESKRSPSNDRAKVQLPESNTLKETVTTSLRLKNDATTLNPNSDALPEHGSPSSEHLANRLVEVLQGHREASSVS